jgi:hypothetical protein
MPKGDGGTPSSLLTPYTAVRGICSQNSIQASIGNIETTDGGEE